jgi:AAA domain, putative AbiEii toxin, Type IV TA system/AAA ATPase domain
VKLRRAHIQNFKGVRECVLDLQPDPGASPRRLTALVGDNGSGKTTVLQAIALTISLATQRTREPESLRWHGFLAERLGTLGPTRVELEILFDPDEVEQTSELYKRWSTPSPAVTIQGNIVPARHPSVTLVFEGGRVLSPQGPEAYFQLLGRYYIKMLLATQPGLRAAFKKVGDIFWFDQHRNLGSRVPEPRRREEPGEGEAARGGEENWSAGVEQLREDLVGWWGYHTSPARDPARDFLARLEGQFSTLFPGTRFAGIAPRDVASSLRRADFYFLFERGGLTYDLAELSSGEQAVFPLLSEFVRLDIARSIVLVDELELHLHPPEQQALLAALPGLGPDCQFIVTTHSPYLADVIPEEAIVRLEGGKPCL